MDPTATVVTNAPTSSPLVIALTAIAAIVITIVVYRLLARYVFSMNIPTLTSVSATKAQTMPPVGVDASGNPLPVPQPYNAAESTLHAVENDVASAIVGDQVYNVSRNIYKYADAAAVCAAFGGQVATLQQVENAYAKGADWCNYGWVQGGMAVYPTQKATWDKLQKGPAENRNACGVPGVNGGWFNENPELQFGVNCYGPRPAPTAADAVAMESQLNMPRTSQMIAFDNEVQTFKNKLGTIGVLPFQPGSWNGSLLPPVA